MSLVLGSLVCRRNGEKNTLEVKKKVGRQIKDLLFLHIFFSFFRESLFLNQK